MSAGQYAGPAPEQSGAEDGVVMTVNARGRLVLSEAVCRQHRLRPGDRIIIAGRTALDGALFGLIALSTGIVPAGGLMRWRADDVPSLAERVARQREDPEAYATAPPAPQGIWLRRV